MTIVRPSAWRRVEQVEHLAGGHEIEVAGGFVDEQQLGVADQRPGDRHALHLAARKLTGVVVGAVFEADGRERRASAPQALGAAHAAVDERRGHVLEGARARQQVVELKDEPEELVAQTGASGVVQVADVVAGEQVGARVGAVEQAEHVQQGRLAGAGAPGAGDPLAAPHLQVEVVEDRQGDVAVTVGAFDAGRGEDHVVARTGNRQPLFAHLVSPS